MLLETGVMLLLCQYLRKVILSYVCDDWRGIGLLDVVGRIVQDRLKLVAENALPDSRRGLRADRGCTEMIFVARQLIEKAQEH